MKKNKMMRLASALLVAVLLTTCGISGTFAKYVTEGSGSDTARVAKWGVQISTEGDGYFTTTYPDDGDADSVGNTVVADVDVVAPGTNQDGKAFFSLTGTPEVAVNVKFTVTGNGGAEKADDVVLAAGEYWDWTKAPYTTKFTATEYHPLVFTLKDGSTTLATGTLAEIEAFLEGKSGKFPAKQDLSKILGGTTGQYTLTWSWPFDSGKDKEDTLLGNIAAEIDSPVGITSTRLYLGIKIEVTQLD